MNISSSGGGGDSNNSLNQLKIQSANSTSSHNSVNANPNANEAGHYVVTAHRPGGVLLSVKCSFLEEGSTDVIISKSQRLEIRQLNKEHDEDPTSSSNSSPAATASISFPLVLSAPINGRIISMLPFKHPSSKTDYIFFLTDRKQYAIISYDGQGLSSSNNTTGSTSACNTDTQTSSSSSSPRASTTSQYNLITHASGDLADYGIAIRGCESECGPHVALESQHSCIAIHFYDGFVTILPIRQDIIPRSMMSGSTSGAGIGAVRTSRGGRGRGSVGGCEWLGQPFHCRIQERTILGMDFLISNWGQSDRLMPQLTLLHQDSRGNQHVISHSVDLNKKTLIEYSDSEVATRKGTTSGDGNDASGRNNNKAPTSPQKASARGRATNTSNSSTAALLPPPISDRLKKSRVDAGSGLIIPVPPIGWKPNRPSQENEKPSSLPSSKEIMGGLLVLGHRQITYHCTAEGTTKILPMEQALIMTFVHVFEPSKEDSTARFLLGDEYGKLHVLAITRSSKGLVTGLHLDYLGMANVATSLVYLESGLVFLGSGFSDSQFIQILEDPITVATNSNSFNANTSMESTDTDTANEHSELLDGSNLTYVSIIEEYTNLGPIVDFDLMPTTNNGSGGLSSHDDKIMAGGGSSFDNRTTSVTGSTQYHQSMIITASGAGKDGSLRVIRNGIGMSEHAAVDLGGIKGMWSLRQKFHDEDDSFLLQSYVGETRILGVTMEEDDGGDADGDVEIEEDEQEDEEDDDSEEEVGGTLEEKQIIGVDSGRSTLFAGNVSLLSTTDSSLMIQITDMEVRLINLESMECSCVWDPRSILEGHDPEDLDGASSLIIVASANESGQIVVALRRGILIYLHIIHEDANGLVINFVGQTDLGLEISCLDLNPFQTNTSDGSGASIETMDVDDRTFTGADRRFFQSSNAVAVGLWDDNSVRVLSLCREGILNELLNVSLGSESSNKYSEVSSPDVDGKGSMARSVCLVTLESASTLSLTGSSRGASNENRVNMLLVGLGDGGLISFAINIDTSNATSQWTAYAKKEVSFGTRAITLVPFHNRIGGSGTCVLATGDRPTVIYLAGGGNGLNANPKLCYSNINLSSNTNNTEDIPNDRRKGLVANVATPFHSSLLFTSSSSGQFVKSFSLCISDESTLRLGMIDDIQKLHVSTYKLGMAPRRVAYHESGRVVCVGCIDDGVHEDGSGRFGGEINMGNCIRFFDHLMFEEIHRLNLDPYEMILSMQSMCLKVNSPSEPTEEGKSQESTINQQGNDNRFFLVVGTAYAYPDEDEPKKGRILLFQSSRNRDITGGNAEADDVNFPSNISQVAQIQVNGGVYSVCPFYNGSFLATVNSKTRICKLVDEGADDVIDIKLVGIGHHGHILSLFVKSLASTKHLPAYNFGANEQDQIAIVGDLMRSISVVQYFPKYQTLEEIARDFNSNWTTAVEMLNDSIYLGGENFHNLFVLQRNKNAKSEELRCRLDTVGLFHLGEMPNKFMGGSLVMPNSSYNSRSATSSTNAPPDTSEKAISNQLRKPIVTTGSQTLYATIDGTIGSVIGLDASTATFFASLERAMAHCIVPVGNLKHSDFRAYRGERAEKPSRGFIDGDLVESFLDLDRTTMETVVNQMKIDGRWDFDQNENIMTYSTDIRPDDSENELTVNYVLSMVEEVSMLH